MQVGQKTSMVLFKVQAGLDLNARWILDDAQEISWQTPEGNNGKGFTLYEVSRRIGRRRVAVKDKLSILLMGDASIWPM